MVAASFLKVTAERIQEFKDYREVGERRKFNLRRRDYHAIPMGARRMSHLDDRMTEPFSAKIDLEGQHRVLDRPKIPLVARWLASKRVARCACE